MLYNAYKTVSITPVYDLDGNFGSNPIADISNPLGELYRNKDKKIVPPAYSVIYSPTEYPRGILFQDQLRSGLQKPV